MVGNDLLILEELNPEKTSEEYSFASVPIWVRNMKIPLGMMSNNIREAIGSQIGEFIEAYVKRIEVAKSLIRGQLHRLERVAGHAGARLNMNICQLTVSFAILILSLFGHISP